MMDTAVQNSNLFYMFSNFYIRLHIWISKIPVFFPSQQVNNCSFSPHIAQMFVGVRSSLLQLRLFAFFHLID